MKKPSRDDRTVKTTVEPPEPLWRDAKIRAIDQGSDLPAVVIAALELYLNSKPRREDSR